MDRERLKGNLDLLLLSVLSSGPAHGYAIISALRDRSGGAFDLPEGTIYPALHRLEDAGLLASTWDRAEGRRRRVYGLTDQGAASLAAQRAEWSRFVGGVHAVLGLAVQAARPGGAPQRDCAGRAQPEWHLGPAGRGGERMAAVLDHISLQCTDLVASAAFYDVVLEPLGGQRIMDLGNAIGYGVPPRSDFWIGAQSTGEGFRESHVAFAAASRAAVRAFFDVAVAEGAAVLHPPRLWPEYNATYFGAFVRDPDGNNIEAVCHLAE